MKLELEKLKTEKRLTFTFKFPASKYYKRILQLEAYMNVHVYMSGTIFGKSFPNFPKFFFKEK